MKSPSWPPLERRVSVITEMKSSSIMIKLGSCNHFLDALKFYHRHARISKRERKINQDVLDQKYLREEIGFSNRSANDYNVDL